MTVKSVFLLEHIDEIKNIRDRLNSLTQLSCHLDEAECHVYPFLSDINEQFTKLAQSLNAWWEAAQESSRKNAYPAVPDAVLFNSEDLTRINEMGEFLEVLVDQIGDSDTLSGYVAFCGGFEQRFEDAAAAKAWPLDGAKDDAAAPEGGAQ